MSDQIPVRFSHLKQMGRSPAHARLAMEQDAEQTTAMARGSAVHSLLLGGKPVVAFPGKVRSGKAWEAFEADHDGSLILTRAEHDKAQRMADAVRAHPEAMALLGGVRERTILWDFCGRRCRSTPDSLTDLAVTELKTCSTSEPLRFTGQALRMGYHAQLAFYREAARSSGSKPSAACIVAVESSAPYPVTVLRLTDRALEQGMRSVRLWMERLLVCEASGSWPGYVESVVDLDVQDDVELDFGDAVENAGQPPF